MDYQTIKSFLSGLKTNCKGVERINDKLLVIESDDWGAIRTPSKQAIQAFESQGMNLSKSMYKVDSLASTEDLEYLFDLLLSIKNANGEHPIITANSIMANPDFERIKASDYKQYYFEPFTETYKKYPKHHQNLAILKKGIHEHIYRPQFHGREHLNIVRWMKALQSGDPFVRYTFDWGCTYSGKEDYAFMEAYDWNDIMEVSLHKRIIEEGMEIFKKTFGFQPSSFIAPCYNWDSKIESTLGELGIKWIQGMSNQLAPTGSFGQYKRVKHVFGERNKFGSRYNIRNVFFEPVTNPTIDWTDHAMAGINAAFLFQKPAVISTHRINYVGYIDPKNRENGLRQFKLLLQKIIKRWPEIKFISTDKLSEYI